VTRITGRVDDACPTDVARLCVKRSRLSALVLKPSLAPVRKTLAPTRGEKLGESACPPLQKTQGWGNPDLACGAGKGGPAPPQIQKRSFKGSLCSRAKWSSSRRFETPGLLKMLVMCFLTVSSAILKK
jgi:hypothetical protein